MASRNNPPWLANRGASSKAPQSQSSVPTKRSADSRAQDRPAKRSTVSTTTQEEAWVADEDRFVLQQSKKKAAIRVKAGRAKPIDWLAVTLRFVDPTKTLMDEEIEDHELDVVDPEGVFEGLGEDELSDLGKDIDHFLTLETNRSNRDYWNALKTICKDRQRQFKKPTSESRTTASVAADIDRILSSQSYDQLEGLEEKTKRKLGSDEPIDYDYWEQLLRTLRVWKAKAKLRKVCQEIVNERLQSLRKQQEEAALNIQKKLQTVLDPRTSNDNQATIVSYDPALDPESELKLHAEDKNLEIVEVKQLVRNVVVERRKVLKLGYVPMQGKTQGTTIVTSKASTNQSGSTGVSRFASVEHEDSSHATKVLYDREVARGVEEGEEIFAAEEELPGGKPEWANKYKPRKPRYFNRVQMGYEWNKYNQTHYDHDNPPPKVVQGYKFNIFYPELIDKSETPNYSIERENGRKQGQSLAPAGEDDTCLIRFSAGPPYEDIAFRIVDKGWDKSARRDGGFKNTFDKGILQIHFQFKKVYYRK